MPTLLQITGDPEWAKDHVSDIVTNCLIEVDKQQPAENETTQPTFNATEITSRLCQLDCGQNGHCSEGNVSITFGQTHCHLNLPFGHYTICLNKQKEIC
jgi:hypothetical protein